MPRIIIWPAVLAALAGCFLAAEPIDISSNRALWDELGLQSAEKTSYGAYTLSAWRFKDSTGALAGLDQIAAEATKTKPAQIGNYVVVCEGNCPPDLTALVRTLPKFRDSPLPVLRTYLPPKGLIPRSVRYVLGPVGLSQAAPDIPSAAAAFQFGSEAVIGKYRDGKNEATLAIFMYPTPQMARQQLGPFENISRATAKRSGPMVGLVLNAPTQKSAEALLKDLEYQASVSWDQQPPLIIRPQTAAQIVLGGFELAGIILVFCVLSGFAYGGFRVLRQKFGVEPAGGGMTVLHLSGK